MRTPIQLITAMSPLRMGVVCDGLDQATKILCEEAPFVVHEFPSGEEHNGWIVPQKWECQKAEIWRVYGGGDSAPFADGNAHPLGVASYSKPFHGVLSGKELAPHLFFSEVQPDGIVYHCDWWYKPHARGWGVCVPMRLAKTVEEHARFHVELKTTTEPGTMKVCEWVLPGSVPDSVIINAHDCHPFCANDDLSGIAVGMEVMRLLAARQNRLTYRFIVGPEHYGSIFWLKRFADRQPLKAALFLESLGTKGRLALQESFHGNAPIDHALGNALLSTDYRLGAFRAIVGNDETCWDSAGYEIACPSLSRCPFLEYHTSLDAPSLMRPEQLDAAVQVVFEALMTLDRNATCKRNFKGLVCLSNPRFDLYRPTADPSIAGRREVSDEDARWHRMMNYLPRAFDAGETVLDLAKRFGLRFELVYDYLKSWEAKGLIEMEPA